MAHYGRTLLQRLRFQYCDWSGSSRGMRDYLDQLLPQLQKLPAVKGADPCTKVYVAASAQPDDPRVQWQVSMKRNRMPFIEAEYKPVSGHTSRSLRTVGVKNLDAKQIEEHVHWLRSSKGRSTQRKVPPKRIISRNPSIQGAWSVETFAAAGAMQQQQQQRQAQQALSAEAAPQQQLQQL